MALFKCKMCGGNLDNTGNTSVITCEYCGTSQTVSKTREEILSNQFNRANDLRIKCEFDRAEQTYEKILEQENTEAEAHWGIVLCRYGIEYVDDPKTGKKIPTCHRTSYEAITSDTDYIAAIENADSQQKAFYETEAKKIDEIQKNILSIARNEAPFDVFICYKETDENGKRTVDSAIANDIYYQLTQEGFKVFYAPITLEDKLGEEYEPYIFAALNSAKVMLVIGTKPEHFNSVWVKNEWSRYLKLIKSDRNKMIIPCYRDMDAYDLPDEFAHLQSQDMSKIGFISDIVRGIRKSAAKEDETIKNSINPNFDTVTAEKPQKTNSGNYHSEALQLSDERALDNRVKSGDTFINLEEYESARSIFTSLINEYPYDYRSWMGMARVCSEDYRDLTISKHQLDYIKYLYENAKKVANSEEIIGNACKEYINAVQVELDSLSKNTLLNIEKTKAYHRECIEKSQGRIDILKQQKESAKFPSKSISIIFTIIVIFASVVDWILKDEFPGTALFVYCAVVAVIFKVLEWTWGNSCKKNTSKIEADIRAEENKIFALSNELKNELVRYNKFLEKATGQNENCRDYYTYDYE